MAYESLWLSIASVLAVFNIDSAKDENGLYITPSGEYSFGFAWYVATSASGTGILSLKYCAFVAIPSRSYAASRLAPTYTKL